MSIKHAILGILAERPRHGYAVRALFEHRLGSLVEIGEGRVYELLARLDADGLVVCEKERVGRRIRKVYSITEPGRRELRRWTRAGPSPFSGPEDVLLRLVAVGSDREASAAIVRRWERQQARLASALARSRMSIERQPSRPPVLEILRQIEAIGREEEP